MMYSTETMPLVGNEESELNIMERKIMRIIF